MKMMMSVALIVWSLTGYAQNTPSEYAPFRKEELRIDAQRGTNTISRTTALKEKLAAAKTYMPNDRITHDYLTSVLDYSERLDRWDRDQAAVKDAEDRRVQEQQRQSPQVVYVDRNSAVNDAIPAAMFLNKVGQAFSNSYNQYLIPTTTCNSWGKGTVMCY